ncbi:hypothetical protein [Clostridium gasigenes]|uniref:hypothetical protein n=1 Tax=Clostridium gasigenes TaxID=94869 RepID=UPI001C0D3952|nr:hypothetical protein [Clostridium gasigenes]MBU3107169.1 hypothetical protein [Clostridium gasigenes]
MKPIKTKTSNSILRGSEGAPKVIDLPITRLQGPNGEQLVESCWELSKEELNEVSKTGKIYFLCVGATHPPILLSTSPAVEEGD